MHTGDFGEILKEGFTLYITISLHWSHVLCLTAARFWIPYKKRWKCMGSLSREKSQA